MRDEKEPPSKDRTIKRLASIIASDLLKNGNGDVAVRLLLELDGGRYGGGLCKSAIEGRIEKILQRARLR